jgi:hypothetical protein
MHRSYRYGKAVGWRCGETGPAVDGARAMNAEPGTSKKAIVFSP